MARITAVVPALDEEEGIATVLRSVRAALDPDDEILVVDGGSEDATVALARAHADQVLSGVRGRARQMNAGAQAASGDVLWFVHADTRVPEAAGSAVRSAVERHARWGRFDVTLTGAHSMLRVVAAAMNIRSRISGIATGDQGIFVTRAAFEAIGGYEDVPLMEDVRLSAALRREGWPACIRHPCLVTSGRRWERHGVWRTIALMMRLRVLHALGASPSWLVRQYRG